MCLLQVAWSRYLVSFQMELADKKCRPSGSPPRDSGFLNLHLRICAFPTHDSGCKFADYFQRCAICSIACFDVAARAANEGYLKAMTLTGRNWSAEQEYLHLSRVSLHLHPPAGTTSCL